MSGRVWGPLLRVWGGYKSVSRDALADANFSSMLGGGDHTDSGNEMELVITESIS